MLPFLLLLQFDSQPRALRLTCPLLIILYNQGILVVKVCWHLCLVFRMPMIPWSQSLEGVCQSPDVHHPRISRLWDYVDAGDSIFCRISKADVGH